MSLLCVGEPLISLAPAPHVPLLEADELFAGIGGAELNVALHLARLGVGVDYVGAVGADPFGDRIAENLADEGVGTSGLVRLPGPTGVYFKDPGPPMGVAYYRAGSAGSALTVPSRQALEEADLVHVSGVGLGLAGEVVTTVRQIVERPRTWRVSFDVNYRAALWTPVDAGPALLAAARSADIVFVGRDEAHAVWDVTDSEELRTLVDSAELVIKDGAADVEIWADGRWWRSTPPAVDVVEPVGAGDAFAAAYLAARLAGRDPASAAANGNRLAGYVMSVLSDQGHASAPIYDELGHR